MARGFLRSLDRGLEVNSAGTEPATEVHGMADKVMAQRGIDISRNYPKDVAGFMDKNFDYVITVCGGARENRPVFTGRVGQRVHMGFDDPAPATGSETEIMDEFRHVRDGIMERFKEFYEDQINVRENNL